MNSELNPTHRARLAAVLIGAALLTVAGAAVPADAGAPAPQHSIAVDDGSTSATTGAHLRYTVTVTNLGTTAVKKLRVTQMVPAGAAFVSADAHGHPVRGQVVWAVDLAPASKVTMRTAMTLGSTPTTSLRLATVACAQVSATGSPVVCATDSDELPAGAADARARADAGAVPAATGWLDGRTPWYAGGGAAVLLAAAGAVLLVRHRRTHAPDVPLGARVAGRE